MCSVIRDQSKVETQNLASHEQGVRWQAIDYKVYGLRLDASHEQRVRWQVNGYDAYGSRWNVPHGQGI